MGKNKKNRNKEKKQRNAVHSVVRLQAIKLWLQRTLIMHPEIFHNAKTNMDFYNALKNEWFDDVQPAVKEMFAAWKAEALVKQGPKKTIVEK